MFIWIFLSSSLLGCLVPSPPLSVSRWFASILKLALSLYCVRHEDIHKRDQGSTENHKTHCIWQDRNIKRERERELKHVTCEIPAKCCLSSTRSYLPPSIHNLSRLTKFPLPPLNWLCTWFSRRTTLSCDLRQAVEEARVNMRIGHSIAHQQQFDVTFRTRHLMLSDRSP